MTEPYRTNTQEYMGEPREKPNAKASVAHEDRRQVVGASQFEFPTESEKQSKAWKSTANIWPIKDFWVR